ncbi:MAG: lipocalin-like domain-containing protein [Mediterranea sp.]|jgi:hypothetical protein|nr:lipocalin-like domain-containing protein [Mediterranea sp.]
MKRDVLKFALLLTIVSYMLTACVNGDSTWTGKWQLRKYEYADGTVVPEDSVFYNMQKGSFSALCMTHTGSFITFWGRYTLKDDELCITLLPGSSAIPEFKRFFGWDDNQRTFHVERITSSALELKYNTAKYVFRKFG